MDEVYHDVTLAGYIQHLDRPMGAGLFQFDRVKPKVVDLSDRSGSSGVSRAVLEVFDRGTIPAARPCRPGR